MPGLNDQQMTAVLAPADKPIMVVAAPGSGKTRVLTERVVYLVRELGIDPATILVTTFTKKASEEMKSRLIPLLGADLVSKLFIGTIHGVCLRILASERLSKDLITLYDQKKSVRTALDYQHLNWEVGWRYPFGWLMKAKTALVEPQHSQAWFQKKLSDCGSNDWQAKDIAQKLARVYTDYETDKRYLNKMDFTDMLAWVAKKLRDDEEFRYRWQRRIQHVLCDEVQDTGALSYNILKTLAAPENRMFAVGDPDQSLYKWNYADPDRNIYGFLDDYPEGQVLPLEINYRSTATIVALSNRCIKANYEGDETGRARFSKVVRPRPGAEKGLDVQVHSFKDVELEAEAVIETIQEMIDLGRNPEDFFIVYRVNSQSRPFEGQLLKRGIPFVIQGSMGFFERKVVKDMLAYLSLSDDPHDNESFERIINMASAKFFRHTRGLGARWIQECLSTAKGNRCSLWDAMKLMKPRQSRSYMSAISDLENLLTEVRSASNGNPAKALGAIRALCYENYLIKSEGIDQETAQDEGFFDDLDELVAAASPYPTIKAFMDYVHEIQELQKEKSKEEVEAVVLTTIHRVKGLERPVVFGVGLADGILPHNMAMGGQTDMESKLPMENLSGLNDERCAAFVLVSRPKEELWLSYPKCYRNKDMPPSRFLEEMGLKVIDVAAEVEEAIKDGVNDSKLAPVG